MKRSTRQTEASVRVLRFDSLPPVLTEEHVCGEGTLGAILALFAGLLLDGSLLLLNGRKHEYTKRKQFAKDMWIYAVVAGGETAYFGLGSVFRHLKR